MKATQEADLQAMRQLASEREQAAVESKKVWAQKYAKISGAGGGGADAGTLAPPLAPG